MDNSDLNNVPNVYQWEGWPNYNQKIVMTNSDIALVRQLHSGNLHSDGKVTCNFVSRGRDFDTDITATCPVARSDLFVHMVNYRKDNRLFLKDFRDALFKMTQTGYAVVNSSNDCDSDGICRLTKL